MDRKEELELMLKGAEVNTLYACKGVCEKGLTLETNVTLDYAINIYHSIRNSLSAYEIKDEPENLTEADKNNAE